MESATRHSAEDQALDQIAKEAEARLAGRRSSEDSLEDAGLNRNIRLALKELEEKFRKAMIAIAQLDNEKSSYAYQVDTKLQELEETIAQLRKELKEKNRDENSLVIVDNKEEPASVPKNANGGTTQSNENTLVSDVHLNYYDLRNIFQYLDGRNLASAAMVCKSWLEAANDEKWTKAHYSFDIDDDFDFFNKMRSIKIKPSVVFYFDYYYEQIESRVFIEDCLKTYLLPKQCKTITLCTEFIIREDYCIYGNMFTCLPQLPNVIVKTFELPEERGCISCMNIQETAEYREIISTINETSTSNETCLMIFCTETNRTTAKRWASRIQESKEDEVTSIWGGVVRDGCECVAVLITGPIQTWSIIVEWEGDTDERIAEARLNLFKNKVKLKNHAIGFIFVSWKHKTVDNWCETYINNELLKRLFPEVRIVGLTSLEDIGGVFGKTTVVDEVNGENNKEEEDWYKEGSFAFMILTY